MKMTKFRTSSMLLSIALCTLMGLNSCQREGLYNPDKNPDELPPMDGYFDFNTVESQTLKVNYNIPGYKASFAVYTENPVVISEGERRLKEGVLPVFEAYTDDNCNYEGCITLPAMVEKVYIYSDYMFVPQCVEVEIANNQICFSADAEKTGSTKATKSAFEVTLSPVAANLYSLYNWGEHGSLPKGYVTETVSTITNGQKVGDLFKRLQSKLGETSTPTKKQNNSSLVSTEEYTNITVSPESADGKKIEGANIDLVYLNERAGYKSTLGYYYYKTEDLKKGLDLKKLPKYIIFPNVSQKNDDPYNKSKGDYKWDNAPLERGMKVRLKFFGENGTGQAEEVFPSGYTIGWFIIANAYTVSNYGDKIDTQKDFYYSNVSANKNGESRCITLFDKKTQKVVVGFEDGEDESYEDILFYVDANPIEAIVDPENPDIPSVGDDDKPIVIPDKINTVQGTLAFEDMWPSGGDYDMNDVILEYKIQVTFDANNKIKKITETFVPVHDGALFANAFGYQVPQELDVQDATKEAGQNLPTYIIFQNARESVKVGTPYSITRNFENNPIVFKVNGQETTDAASIFKQYNPFIVPNYVAGNQIRNEVHLPKYKGTALVDESLIGSRDDAYYLDRSGAYPFAIQLPVTGFKPVTESVRIDSGEEYPDFRKWADSMGKEATDWYLNYQKK